MDDINRCIANVPETVTEEINRRLLRPFSREEIVVALGQIHPIKAPGPDGMSEAFYR